MVILKKKDRQELLIVREGTKQVCQFPIAKFDEADPVKAFDLSLEFAIKLVREYMDGSITIETMKQRRDDFIDGMTAAPPVKTATPAVKGKEATSKPATKPKAKAAASKLEPKSRAKQAAPKIAPQQNERSPAPSTPPSKKRSTGSWAPPPETACEILLSHLQGVE